ncbi:MAG: tetratricopeptide repeat protein [Phycisphaerales bacterium]|nr:tetratricopeptide repeat protein [Phycisphaerales bacterium]
MHSRFPILTLAPTLLLVAGAHAAPTALPRQELPTHAASASLVTDGYVDDARCAKCHEDIAATYAHLGMGRSFHVAGGDDAIADFSAQGGTFHHEASNLHYRMRLDDEDRMWMEQYELDEDGEPINAVDIEAHFSVGSGNHARTYLHQSASGELWELPVTWYTKNGWNMSPGFNATEHHSFGRKITRECMFCHNAYPDVPVGSDVLGKPDVFPTTLPSGIGCQRCHGPGAQHVSLAYSADATDEAIRESILNPENLSPALADDVCLQCHMQPTSRLGSLVRPYDHGDFSYRPGEPLGEYIVHVDFDTPPEHPSFEVNHHGYRLRESPCWQGPGSPGCLDCHDPHAKLSTEDIAARTRATCLTCHQPVDCNVEQVMQVPRTEAQDCASCHMPTRHSNDAIHIEVTDHLIQMPLAQDQLLPLASDIPPPTTFTGHVLEPDRFTDGKRMRAWEVLGEIIGNNSSNVQELAALAERDDFALTTAEQLVFAQGLMDAGRNEEAHDAFAQIIERDPTLTMAQQNIASLEFAAGDSQGAMRRLEQLAQDHPDDAGIQHRLGIALQAGGNLDGAIRSLTQAAELRSTDHTIWSQLGLALASKGDFESAAAALQRSESLKPGNPAAGYNLGLALWNNAQRLEAARAWTHALQRSPESPRLLHAAAVTSSLPWDGFELNTTRGLKHARALAQLQPSSPDASIMLAASLLAAGDAAAAASELNRAAQLKADLAAIRLVQAMLMAQLGNQTEGDAVYRRVLPRITQLNMLREGLLNRASGVFGDN